MKRVVGRRKVLLGILKVGGAMTLGGLVNGQGCVDSVVREGLSDNFGIPEDFVAMPSEDDSLYAKEVMAFENVYDKERIKFSGDGKFATLDGDLQNPAQMILAFGRGFSNITVVGNIFEDTNFYIASATRISYAKRINDKKIILDSGRTIVFPFKGFYPDVDRRTQYEMKMSRWENGTVGANFNLGYTPERLLYIATWKKMEIDCLRISD